MKTPWEEFMDGEIDLHEMTAAYENQPCADNDTWKFVVTKHLRNTPIYAMVFLLAFAVLTIISVHH